MSDNIQNMDFKKLRNEVQLLRDELAIMKRKYEDILYNLDDDNFSSQFLKEKDNMRTQIEVTAEGIKTTVEDIEGLSSEISQTSNIISAVVRGDYTENILKGYFTGIVISPNQIKMTDNNVYSVYNSDGLKFYDSSDDVEGWSIEPDKLYGGLLNYYVNNSINWVFGRGLTNYVSDDAGYTTTDMTIYGEPDTAGGFVVDVSESANPQIKFFVTDWSTTNDTPRILANGQLLATQDWVLANGGGEATAVFG